MAPLAAKTVVPRRIDFAKKAGVVKKPTVETETGVVPEFFIPAPEPREDIYGLPAIYDPPTSTVQPTRTRITTPFVPSPDAPSPTPAAEYPTAALMVGGVSLMVASMSAGIGADDPTNEALIFSGVMAGVSVAAFAVGGIIYLIEAGDDGTRVGIGPGSVLVDGSF
jgi:hypothetical protein